jgi:hypothetical protein
MNSGRTRWAQRWKCLRRPSSRRSWAFQIQTQCFPGKRWNRTRSHTRSRCCTSQHHPEYQQQWEEDGRSSLHGKQSQRGPGWSGLRDSRQNESIWRTGRRETQRPDTLPPRWLQRQVRSRAFRTSVSEYRTKTLVSASSSSQPKIRGLNTNVLPQFNNKNDTVHGATNFQPPHRGMRAGHHRR